MNGGEPGPSQSRPLHERVADALDVAGDRTGTDLLEFIAEHFAHDAELVAECHALFATSQHTVPVLDDAPTDNAALASARIPRAALEDLHARLASGTATLATSTLGGTAGQHRVLPQRLGAYRVVRILGEGGMGVVYEAEQANPKRRVAVKVIRSAHAGAAARSRFRNEAQALARLKHPGIAQVIEASADDSTGDAFFVMEFVDGPALTAFAQTHTLNVRDRVELLAQVCDAVQHAHQKGVIHRDLKPANILVERSDTGAPRPKVLDFGVAKLTAADDHAATIAVDAHRIVGTLGFMAPEALEPGPDGIDTRADVYALGVILHELLTGQLPIDVRDTTLAEAARRVREQTPAPLSRANRSLRGDLEAIASTALAKQRERRYASAGELGADLRRWLRHEVIAAKPPSTIDALRKFVRRKRGLAMAVAVSALVLICATAFSTIQYLRAERARSAQAQQTLRAERATARAESVKRYFVSDIIAAAAPNRRGAEAKVIDVLDDAYSAMPERLKDDPELRADLHYEFSSAYETLGRYDAAIDAARRAAQERQTLHGKDDIRTIDALNQLAISLNAGGKFDESEPVLKDLIDRTQRTLPPEHEARLRLAATYGNLLQTRGDTDTAIPMLTEAAHIAERALPKENPVRISVRGNLAAALMRAGKVEDAVTELGKLVDEQRTALAPSDPAVVATLNNYIVGLLQLKRIDEAVTNARDLADRVATAYPQKHPTRAYALSTLAAALQSAGRYDEALAAGESAHAACTAAIGDGAWETEMIARRLVGINLKRKDQDAARRWALEAQRIRCFVSGPDEGDTLAKSFDDEARRLAPNAREAIALELAIMLASSADNATPIGHPMRAKYHANLASAMLRLGNADAAPPLLAAARSAAGENPDADLTKLLTTVEGELASWRAQAAQQPPR